MLWVANRHTEDQDPISDLIFLPHEPWGSGNDTEALWEDNAHYISSAEKNSPENLLSYTEDAQQFSKHV